jgi:hypothetical protein
MKPLSRRSQTGAATSTQATRPLSKLMVHRFSGLFWPLFDPNCRGNIRKLILPLQFGSKSGSKEPEKRQNINFERGLLLIEPETAWLILLNQIIALTQKLDAFLVLLALFELQKFALGKCHETDRFFFKKYSSISPKRWIPSSSIAMIFVAKPPIRSRS